MGGSSPHCGAPGRDGTAFSKPAANSRSSNASKRWLPQNGGGGGGGAGGGAARNGNGNGVYGPSSQVVVSVRHGFGSSKASKRECGECGRVLASRIVVTAVVVWLIFQSVILLQGFVTKQAEMMSLFPGRGDDLERSFFNGSRVGGRKSKVGLELAARRADGSIQPGKNSSGDGTVVYSDQDYEGTLESEVAAERELHAIEDVERIEEEELDERKEQAQATFEDVNRGVKRAEREKFENHERDDGELERTGQPLCIYETYDGSSAWAALHLNYPLYRGLSLTPRERRPKLDDIDAASRLLLLNDTFYRDSFCDFGGFLAIANRIDRIHKNSWIGFQPWRAASASVALSRKAETAIVEAVRLNSHGDAVYFWAGSSGDFWSSCDARNAGNCRRIFMESFTTMYGIRNDQVNLPTMPPGIWSSMHCWAMSTPSFMEYVMFSRMFVDALDSRLYVDHHDRGNCALASTQLEGQHCYCRLLEVLVNVWAYHSGRRLVFVDPQTGQMSEQNAVESRRGKMKVKWFSFTTLKGMDEDMAEKADEERPSYRWLWPHTGEVFWQGILERERQERYNQKIERKRRNKERLARMRSRYKQKSLGRYVKPPPEDDQAAAQ